jgi:hypothetical protein
MMTNEKPVAAMMTGETPAPDAGLRRVVRANVITVVFEVIVPMVLFYGLRAAGVSQWWALMAGVLVAAPYVGWTVARNRRVDLVALFTLSVLAVGRPSHARDPGGVDRRARRAVRPVDAGHGRRRQAGPADVGPDRR